MRKLNSLLLIPFALSFVACGPAGGNISGTITAPAGVVVNGSVVLAILCSDSCTKLASQSTANALATADGGYTLPNVAGGQYVVGAVQDTNGDNKGDYIGIYGSGTQASAVQPPASGINIRMTPYTGTASLSMKSNPSALLEAIRKISK